MKIIFLLLAAVTTASGITAQQKLSELTITVTGNKNLKITIDGQDPGMANSTTFGSKTTFIISDLPAGQHNFVAIRTDLNTNRQAEASTPFNLRPRYDLQLNLNPDGSFELVEIKNTGLASGQSPMSNTNFNILLRNVRNQRTAAGKRTLIANAFDNPNYYFTTNQVGQLVQLVIPENDRLQLIKSSYAVITDQGNFYELYSLLKNPASRKDLEDYVYSYNDEGNLHDAMPDASFNALYQEARNKWPVSAQMTYLKNSFNSPNYFFTVNQASQLIQIVNAESNRLQLAKLSYRSIVDRSNFGQIFNLLSFQSSKDELTAYVNNYRDDNTQMAMSDASFNALYQQIMNQWPVSAQMNSLTNAFSNTANYFTVYQASQLIQIVSSESNRLQLAKLSYRSIVDRNNFSQVYNLLSFQSSKDELTAYVNNYRDDNTQMAMPDASFNALYQQIRNQWPVSAQMNSLTNAFNNPANYFTVYQASQLIEIVVAESNRLQLAKLSYRSIVDRDNFNQVYNLLSYQSSKDELTAYINNYGSGNTTRVPMSDSEFNTLYQNIQMQFLPGAKMSALTGTFNNTSYFFTSAQAKQLIQLVSLESNRLQLAKLSYRTITDRANFSQLYDLLNSQASRDELDAYVKSYTE